VVGLEALIRWDHPTRGLVGPIDFIDALEETGLIVPVGRWVLHEACDQLGKWLDMDPDGPPLTMGVNVSGIQLRDPEFVRDLEELIMKSELCATNLILEITESVAMSQESSVLLSLLDKGLHVAIDDFGTGYSSMSSLRKIPADILKIDKAFVDDVSSDPIALAIVRAISDLARTVGMETVAEGVEDAEQLRTLFELGCDNV
ncbi:diguanylate cyclase/phosphodiesterase with PAS/PAC sensor(s), partial [mine drainage metagenome]